MSGYLDGVTIIDKARVSKWNDNGWMVELLVRRSKLMRHWVLFQLHPTWRDALDVAFQAMNSEAARRGRRLL